MYPSPGGGGEFETVLDTGASEDVHVLTSFRSVSGVDDTQIVPPPPQNASECNSDQSHRGHVRGRLIFEYRVSKA